MSAQHTHKTKHWHLPASLLVAVAVVALALSVVGVAFLEMSHPLTAAILSLR